MKHGNDNILFSSSGCLSVVALERCAREKLNSDEISKVEQHLKSCPFCAEALEGYKMMSAEDFGTDHQWLEEKLHDFLAKAGDGSNNIVQNDFSQAGKPAIRTIKPFYLRMIAAMLLLLVSVGGWFVLQYYANDWRAKQTASLAENIDPIAWPEDEVSVEMTTEPIYQEIILNPPTPPREFQTVQPEMVKDAASLPENRSKDKPDDRREKGNTVQGLIQAASKEQVMLNDLPEQAEIRSIITDEAETRSEIFVMVEQMPEFPGGEEARLQYLIDAVVYPEKAKKNAVEGTVFVSFVVEPDGFVDQIKVLRGIGSGCDEAAVEVVKQMPRWSPGIQRGKAVRVIMNLPIRFSI